MSYNPNTRLLLNFEGGSPGDTSTNEHALDYAGGYALATTSGPFGDQALSIGIGGASTAVGPVTASDVFSTSDSYTISRRLDFWVNPTSTGGIGYLFNLDSYGEAALQIYESGGAIYANVMDLTAFFVDDGMGGYYDWDVQEASAGISGLYGSWHHVRVYISGQTLTLGVDGTDYGSVSLSEHPIFKSGVAVDQFHVGHPYATPATALIDCVQVLEDDDTWTGGSYTVPTAPPDDGVSTPTSVTGSGANTLDNLLGAGAGDVTTPSASPISGSGGNTLGNVTGVGIGTVPPIYNNKTRRLLKFNDFGSLVPIPFTSYSLTEDSSNQASPAALDTSIVQHVSGGGVFGSSAMRFGNPSGTYASGGVEFSAGPGLFADETTSSKRFDLWFKPEAASQGGIGTLFSLRRSSADFIYAWFNATSVGVNIRRGGVEVSTSGSFTSGTGTWRHLRIYFSGNTVKIGVAGNQIASNTLSTTAWMTESTSVGASAHIGAANPSILSPATYGLRGLIDTFQILENDDTWTGGSYTVPTAEPVSYDPYAVTGIVGSGANTVTNTSHGTGVVIPISFGSGANTLGNLVSVGVGATERFGTGHNTLDNIASEGVAAIGVFLIGSGHNTTGQITSASSGFITPMRKGTGVNLIDTIAGAGEGNVTYVRSGVGGNAVDAASVGTGVVTNAGGVGRSSCSVSSSGVGRVAVTGAGYGATNVVSNGDGSAYTRGAGANIASVFSSGTGGPIATGRGANVVSLAGSGVALFAAVGSGSSGVSVTSIAAGGVLAKGSGGNVLDDVITQHDSLPTESVICKTLPRRLFIKTKQQSVQVTT